MLDACAKYLLRHRVVLDVGPDVEHLASLRSSDFNCLSGAVQKFAVIGLPHASTNGDGDLDIEVTLDRIRVGADGVRALDKLSCRGPVDAGDGHCERG